MLFKNLNYKNVLTNINFYIFLKLICSTFFFRKQFLYREWHHLSSIVRLPRQTFLRAVEIIYLIFS